MPSICTRHRRQEPKASNCSVAQSLGIFTSDSAAARITEVPAGTVTSLAVDGEGHELRALALRCAVDLVRQWITWISPREPGLRLSRALRP